MFPHLVTFLLALQQYLLQHCESRLGHRPWVHVRRSGLAIEMLNRWLNCCRGIYSYSILSHQFQCAARASSPGRRSPECRHIHIERGQEVGGSCVFGPAIRRDGPACPSDHNPRFHYYMRLRLALCLQIGAGFCSCGSVWMPCSPPWQENFKLFPHLS